MRVAMNQSMPLRVKRLQTESDTSAGSEAARRGKIAGQIAINIHGRQRFGEGRAPLPPERDESSAGGTGDCRQGRLELLVVQRGEVTGVGVAAGALQQGSCDGRTLVRCEL